ncbi:M24 family metallopeptidase [Paraclostridium bifermentans]|uniref:M24 family metallopeptidase n=1 Tax=Paraclostridium bifermentans TaxID=1490 RepID=UPI00359C2D5F
MNRIERLSLLLNENNLDAIFLTKQSNVNYISKFTDEAAFVLACKDKHYLITDGRFTELAQKECVDFEIINWHLFDRNLIKAVDHVCKENNVKRLGFEKNNITFDRYESLKNILNDVELIGTEGMVESLRYIKDETEASYIKKACEISDKALEELVPHIKVGVSEKELCAKLEYYLKMNGADEIGFETILISGSKTSLPHGKPDKKLIEEGDFVTIDFGAKYNGYISDMTRTFVVGKASDKHIEIYNLVKEAQQVGLDNLRAGVLANEPDKAIREVIKKYEEFYYPGIGHGVGMDLHEEPFLGNYGAKVIEEGCIITMEPGLYIPGFGGVRIEDTVVVTKDGIEILTKFPKDLMIL